MAKIADNSDEHDFSVLSRIFYGKFPKQLTTVVNTDWSLCMCSVSRISSYLYHIKAYWKAIKPFFFDKNNICRNINIVNGDEIIIDGEVATSYTFAQDYYWMMGDNRGNSQDSRSWGFVPFDHVLGKPVFVWFSWDTQATGFNKIRWNRLFTTVSGEGKPVSYFKYFLILLAGWFVFNHFRKKKKAAAK